MFCSKSRQSNPTGATFISYRQSDGAALAASIAWALRSAGIPVWHDKTDLPPGDTTRSLKAALASGLSGAVLIVTPEISKSKIVRKIELPRILKLARRTAFVFAIGTTIRKATGTVDYSAADELLKTRRGALSNRVQHSIDAADGPWKLVEDLLDQRIKAIHSSKGDGQDFVLHVQTRTIAKSWDNDGSDLTVRFAVPTDGTLPSSECLDLLAKTLPMIARAIPLARTNTVQIKGGMHLSVGLSFGMALPRTVVSRVEVLDVDGTVWSLDERAQSTRENSFLERTTVPVDFDPAARKVLVFVDLLASPSSAAFELLLTNQKWSAAEHIRMSNSPQRIAATDGGAIVDELSSLIRTLSGEHENAEVHLLLRSPVAIAILLGTMLNTVPVTTYEWTAGDGVAQPAHYEPVLKLLSGSVNGPIVGVIAR